MSKIASGKDGLELDGLAADPNDSQPAVLPVVQGVPPETTNDAAAYPDGGLRAWSCVAGGFLSNFASLGHNSAFGVYQELYETTLLPTYTSSTIAWIGSIQLSLLLAVALVSGRLFDRGYMKVTVATGSLIYILCIFMTSLATEYWQLLLAQGIGQGLGAGLLFAPSYAACFHWFAARRGLAVGLQSAGSGLGAIVISLALQAFFTGSLGFAWGVRIVGFVLAGCLVASTWLIKTRLPPKKATGPLIKVSMLAQDRAFAIYCANAFVVSLGLYLPMYFLPTFASSRGLPRSFAFQTVTILSAGGTVGRIVGSQLGDHWGAMNSYIISLFACCILSLCWSAVDGLAGVATFAVLYGLASGSAISGIPSSVGSLSFDRMNEIGGRSGLLFGFEGVASLVGPPIGGAVLRSPSGIVGTSIYGGASFVAAIGLSIWSRRLLARRKGTWRV